MIHSSRENTAFECLGSWLWRRVRDLSHSIGEIPRFLVKQVTEGKLP